MSHRKNHTARLPARGSKAPFLKRKARLVRRVAHGTLLAVGFSALQFFSEDAVESKRLFDHRVVDNLQLPLTRYHE